MSSTLSRFLRSLPAAALCLTAAALAFLGLPARRAEAQFQPLRATPSPYQAWGQVREYNIRYKTSFHKSFTIVWDWHPSTHDYRMDFDGTADGKLTLLGSNGRIARYEGMLKNSGTYTLHEDWYSPDQFLGTTDVSASGTGELGDTYCSLEIDIQAGTYRLLLTDIGINGTITWADDDGSFTREGTCQIVCPLQENVPLPGNRPPLVFEKSVQVDAPPLWLLADPYKADLDVSYTISPVGPKPEFLLKPVRAQWLPEPDKTIQVNVVPKKPNQAPAPVRFILEEITQEPGTCLNSQQVDTDPDMEFDALANAAQFELPEITGPNSFRMETDEPVTRAAATVRARDYGAWAKIRAEALVDGGWQPIPVEGSKLGYLTLPVDKNLNKISDDWEKKNKVAGKPATWDGETKPLLNGEVGDGLSLYEEYRGLLVQGKHQRQSPLAKKLFVENKIGAQAKSGIGLLASASKLKVITLNPGELPPSRMVNQNSSFAKTRAQYGLRLNNVQLAEGTLGEAVPIEKTNKRPADCTEVRIDVAQILASPEGYNVQAELNNTIAHEMGHGIGASHHGEGAPPLINRYLGDREVAPAHTVYGSDGKEITTRPFQIKGTLGGLGSTASGDDNCIMCYNSFFQWAVQRTPQGQYRYYAQQYRLPGTRFCTSAKGTGVNAPGHKPASYFGNAERGNCLAQLCPKDR